jgi:two-component system, NarL family, sensor histidine kinase BarA
VTAKASMPDFMALSIGAKVTLESLVDSSSMRELLASFYTLFRTSLRILSEGGHLVARTTEEPPLHAYLKGFDTGARLLGEVYSKLKIIDPGPSGEASYTCFSGATYYVGAIGHDGRRIGRIILGPFVIPTVTEPPSSLLACDPDLDVQKTKNLWRELPRARKDTATRIARHVLATLDVMLFSGHKALLAENLQLSTVKDGYRELAQKTEKLEAECARLQELEASKYQFLATVSHELRAPLTSIVGYSEILAESMSDTVPGEQMDFVLTIREQADRLLALTTRLLDLSQLEAGSLTIRKEDTNLVRLLDNVRAALEPMARQRSIRLLAECDSGAPMVWADATRLGQILLSLGDNALKFTPEGGQVRLSVHRVNRAMGQGNSDIAGLVLAERLDPVLEIRVTDTGVGIPDTAKTKVFDAFYQLQSNSEHGRSGCGLGLSIVKHLVEAQQGKVWIEDNQPQGTVAVVHLPL